MLKAVLDFGPTARTLDRFPDTITNYTVLVFTATGQLLGTQSGSRTPGSGPITVTFTGLPPGSVVVRVIGIDGSGTVVGYQDLGATLGGRP